VIKDAAVCCANRLLLLIGLGTSDDVMTSVNGESSNSVSVIVTSRIGELSLSASVKVKMVWNSGSMPYLPIAAVIGNKMVAMLWSYEVSGWLSW